MKKIFFIMLAMVVCASFVQAEEIVVSGAQTRVDAAANFLAGEEGATVKRAYTNEVMGSIKGNPWPGVNVVSDGVAASGIFVPLSDDAVKNGLCEDQKRLLASIIVPPPCAPVVTQTCDEGIFGGRVPVAVLRVRPEGSAAIELHFRPNKSQPYKAKRGFVKTDSKFYPETWPNGSCMVKRSVNPMTNVNMMDLLYLGENLMQVMEEDGKTPFTDHGGGHDTIALYVVIAQ